MTDRLEADARAPRPPATLGTPVPHGRQTMPAGQGARRGARALLVWAVLYAPSLKRASEAQPLGTRRTVSLWVLRPLAAISDFVLLTSATDGVSSACSAATPTRRREATSIDMPCRPPDARPGRLRLTEARRARRRGHQDPPADAARTSCASSSSATRSPPASGSTSSASSARRSCACRGRAASRPDSSRLDYFDWLGAMQRDRERLPPDLVVVMIGDNDNQSLQTPDGQTVAEIGIARVAAGLRGPGRGVHAHRGRRRRARGVGGPADRRSARSAGT